MLDIIAAIVLTSAKLQDSAMPGLAMAERVSAAAANPSNAKCDEAISESQRANAEGLFTGASICGGVDRVDDTVFLTLAGQARAMADMNAATSDVGIDGSPPFGVIDLYGFIYGYAGGAGPTELYRDKTRTDAIFARLRAWRPERPDDYNPGWNSTGLIDGQSYRTAISEVVEGRIAQLSNLARLNRNDAYFALQQELEALMAANDNTFETGSPAHDRLVAIQAEQAEMAAALEVAP